MIAPIGKQSVRSDGPAMSTQDDERVQIDPAVAHEAELDRVGGERRERRRDDDDPAVPP
jgi:hypothetical protein